MTLPVAAVAASTTQRAAAAGEAHRAPHVPDHDGPQLADPDRRRDRTRRSARTPRPATRASCRGQTRFTLDNYRNAWKQGDMAHHYWVTAIDRDPRGHLTLLLSSIVAFGVSRFPWRFNIVLLLLFTAGNLLPPQVLAQPLFQMYKRIPLPGFLSDTGYMLGSTLGVDHDPRRVPDRLLHVRAEQLHEDDPGRDRTEAAKIDGASVLRQFFQIILPLCRPALAALGDAAVHVGVQRLLLGRAAARTRAPTGRSRRRSPTSGASSSPTTTSSPPARCSSPSRPSPCT